MSGNMQAINSHFLYKPFVLGLLALPVYPDNTGLIGLAVAIFIISLWGYLRRAGIGKCKEDIRHIIAISTFKNIIGRALLLLMGLVFILAFCAIQIRIPDWNCTAYCFNSPFVARLFVLNMFPMGIYLAALSLLAYGQEPA